MLFVLIYNNYYSNQVNVISPVLIILVIYLGVALGRTVVLLAVFVMKIAIVVEIVVWILNHGAVLNQQQVLSY